VVWHCDWQDIGFAEEPADDELLDELAVGEVVAGLGVALMLPPFAPGPGPPFGGLGVRLLASFVALPAALVKLVVLPAAPAEPDASFGELAALPPPVAGDCGVIPENAYQKQNALTKTRPTHIKARFTKISRFFRWPLPNIGRHST